MVDAKVVLRELQKVAHLVVLKVRNWADDWVLQLAAGWDDSMAAVSGGCSVASKDNRKAEKMAEWMEHSMAASRENWWVAYWDLR